MVNYNDSWLQVELSPKGRLRRWDRLRRVSASVLTAKHPDAQNSLDEPEHVSPEFFPNLFSGRAGKLFAAQRKDSCGLVLTLPAWSVAILNLTFSRRFLT